MGGQTTISNYLQNLGYDVNEKPFKYISLADDWYRNKILPFHKKKTLTGIEYELERLNFAKRLCSDDANLCEIIEINAQNNDENRNYIDELLKKNNFDVMYRKQLEQMSATGTVGAYIRIIDAVLYDNGDVKGGNIVINYAEASNIVVLNCINNEILEVAFRGVAYDRKGASQCIVCFTLNNGKYDCRTAYFDEYGKLLDESVIHLGEVKPFSIMRVAEVNNLDDMLGYGYPKIYNAIPNLEILDLTYNMWHRDLEKSDKMVFLSKELGQYNEKTQQYELPSDECRKIFLQVDGNSLPQENQLAQEYNPIIRIDEVEKSMELSLSMLSLSFGYGTRKYTFEDGKIVTATEYIGSRQDMLQEVNKQRYEAIQYITGIIQAIRWFSGELNIKTLPDDEITINFDDSYITNKDEELKTTRDDAMSFNIPQLKIKYLCQKYGIDEEEAQRWLNNVQMDIDEYQPEDDEQIKDDIEEVVTKQLNGAQTQSLINIIGQFKQGILTENQAINIISVSIGVSKDEAKELLQS